MSLTIHYPVPVVGAGGLVADRRLYITADGVLVQESDPAAAYLLAGKGQQIPAEVVARLTLRLADGKVAQGPAPVVEEAPEPAVSPDEGAPEPVRPMPSQSRRSRRKN